MIAAAVPVKDLINAKRRLMAVLSAPERAELARTMLSDVLRAVVAARLDRVWVVSRDPAVAALARDAGADVLAEPENRGHTAAVALAQGRALADGARTFITVPGDVPCVTPGEIKALADTAAAAAPAAVLAPSRSGLGTNGVALAPPDALPLTFGEPSFDNHVALARGRALNLHVLALPRLGLDVDSPEDLEAVLAEGAETETGRLLAGWAIDDRLRAARAAVGR